MGDLRNLKATTISPLPPGFRFFPSEEQLFSYYLTEKNNHQHSNHPTLRVSSSAISDVSLLDFNAISEIDLYNYDPCDLPEITCFPFGRGGVRKHWYCYTLNSVADGSKRKASGGFWKSRGRVRDVVDEKEGMVLGKRTTFFFYRGRSSSRKKTDWSMYEYALADHHGQKDSFVLCRVFLKSRSGIKTSEHAPISCAEESIAAMHDAGFSMSDKQQDGVSISGIGEVVALENASMDICIENQKFMKKSVTKLDNQHMARPLSDYGLQLPTTIIKQEELVKSFNGNTNGSLGFGDTVADVQVNSSTLDGDFLELDDLISPLPQNELRG